MAKVIEYSRAQKILVRQWFIFSAVIFVLYIVQAMAGKFSEHTKEVWEWLFQFLLPPLTLMLGVVINQMVSRPTERKVDLFYFRLASGVSYFYLVLVLLSPFLAAVFLLNMNSEVLIGEITEENRKTIIDAYHRCNAFMIPVQGITTLALGLFFTHTSNDEES